MKKRNIIYGISDLIIDEDKVPTKYVKVYDQDGNLLGEVEVYVIGYEDKED